MGASSDALPRERPPVWPGAESASGGAPRLPSGNGGWRPSRLSPHRLRDGQGQAPSWSPVDGWNPGSGPTRDPKQERALTGLDEAVHEREGSGGLRAAGLLHRGGLPAGGAGRFDRRSVGSDAAPRVASAAGRFGDPRGDQAALGFRRGRCRTCGDAGRREWLRPPTAMGSGPSGLRVLTTARCGSSCASAPGGSGASAPMRRAHPEEVGRSGGCAVLASANARLPCPRPQVPSP